MGARSNYEKGVYDQLMEVMARLDSVEKTHKEEAFQMKEEISSLKKENQKLREENRKLKDDNARLKGIMNNDSSNTSNPPSSDQKGGKAANAYNGRQKSGKKSGGQKGHRGTTLTKAQAEEKIRSGKCRHKVIEIGNSGNENFITKYVLDVEAVPVITEIRIYADEHKKFRIPKEYRSDVTYGEWVKAMAVALYSEGVMSGSRIAAFLNEITDGELGLSEGSVYGFCRKFSQKVETDILGMEEKLLNQPVVATDATVVTVNGEQRFIRNFSAGDTVLYQPMEKKSLPALRAVPFLARYTGTLVHDHETALYHFGTRHGECNAHLLRYLRKNTEESKNKWSEKMAGLLRGMNRERKKAAARGETGFPQDTVSAYKKRYAELLSEGRIENQGTEHKYAKADEKKLLNRMEKYRKNHLLFLEDFDICFDNNMSERDLRKAKNRQKMAGGFRKGSGHEMYCRILTIIETLKRRHMPFMENIRKVFSETAPAIF